MKYFFPIFFCLLFYSCKNSNERSDEFPIARVGDRYLYPSDLLGKNHELSDTSLITPEAINTWINKELLYNYVSKKQSVSAEIENKLFDYEQSLLINSYEESVLMNFPISITEDMILSYYKENGSKYEILEDVYKFQYLVLSDAYPELDSIIGLLNKDIVEASLESFCKESEGRCLLNPSWVSSDILASSGLPEYMWKESAKFQKFYLDNYVVLLYRILDKRKIGEKIPLEIVKEEIREVLLFQKQKELLRKKEEEIISKALNDEEVEIFK
ncbi:MAG: hypothetical protein H6579_00090 [Chitinophagales bacterium]|nr:hypothetical protein [Chitinophagales bacterium]